MSAADVKADQKAALDRIQYWSTHRGPTKAQIIGMVLAIALPYACYTLLPAPRPFITDLDRITLLFKLQILPAIVVVFYIFLTGAQRVPFSVAAAQDPGAVYAANLMPIAVHSGNRAFINTLEQYALLLSASSALVMYIPANQAKMITAHYVTWAIARVLFGIGYVKSGSGRMIGFPATVLPSFAAIGYAIYLAQA